MKLSKNLYLATCLSLMMFTTQAHADVNVDQNHYLKITREQTPQGPQVKFEDCYHNATPECQRTLGPHEWYSAQSISSRHTTKVVESVGAIFADAVGVVALVYGGFVVGGSIAAGSVSAAGAGGALGAIFDVALDGIGGAFTGAAVGVGASATLITVVHAINPVEQFREARTLRNDVASDENVEINNIGSFIDRLEAQLQKL